MQGMLKNRSAKASFPSGDAGGAAVFAVTGVLVCPEHLALFGLCALVGSFGRVFFHAHYMLEVVVGEAITIAVTLLMALFSEPYLHWSFSVLKQTRGVHAYQHRGPPLSALADSLALEQPNIKR